MNDPDSPKTINSEVLLTNFQGGMKMKRKAARNQAVKNNTTPKESMADTEFAAEAVYSSENPAKGANRNSKNGSKGRSGGSFS